MPHADPVPSFDARRQFLHALRRVLRPIVRLLIRHGIGYAEFADVARGAYVECAIRDSAGDGARPTREQVAQITGIPRQRVDHYIDHEDALPATRSTLANVLVETLHRWHTDPRYLDPDRVPLELEFESLSGPSFQGIVAEVNSKASPAAVLEELLRTKSVIYSDENRLRVVTRSFIWPRSSPHGIENFGASLAQLIRTLEYNLNSASAKNNRLERFVSADQGLPARLLPSFHDFAKERANQFLLDLDDWVARFSSTVIDQEGPRTEAGINVFFFVESPPDPRTLSTLVQPARRMAAPEDEPAS
jgi:hypothetical protein